jgi:CheY-like chemotaxis protein
MARKLQESGKTRSQVNVMPTTRVTVVNDDTAFLELMETLLEDKGWETTSLFEGNSAFQTIKQDRPDVVILDIRMEQPDTGWRVLNLLMLDPETRTIPVIICSADWSELEQKGSWLIERGVGVLPRPFDLDDLYAAVDGAMAREFPRLVPHEREA